MNDQHEVQMFLCDFMKFLLSLSVPVCPEWYLTGNCIVN